MSGVVLPFRRADGVLPADDLGTAQDWITSAIVHLKTKSSGQVDGSVNVSVAALHLVLGHLEHLEGRLGFIPAPGGAA